MIDEERVRGFVPEEQKEERIKGVFNGLFHGIAD
jgi:hypothetical protein